MRYKVLPPLQKLTAEETLLPLFRTSSTHSVKTLDSFLTEQSIKAIAKRESAAKPLAPKPAAPKAYQMIRLLLLVEHLFDFLLID